MGSPKPLAVHSARHFAVESLWMLIRGRPISGPTSIAGKSPFNSVRKSTTGGSGSPHADRATVTSWRPSRSASPTSDTPATCTSLTISAGTSAMNDSSPLRNFAWKLFSYFLTDGTFIGGGQILSAGSFERNHSRPCFEARCNRHSIFSSNDRPNIQHEAAGSGVKNIAPVRQTQESASLLRYKGMRATFERSSQIGHSWRDRRTVVRSIA